MLRLLTHEVINKVGQKVLVKGWVDSLRLHGKLIFADLRDRGGLLQLVFHKDISIKAFAESKKLKPEYVVEVTGKIKERETKMVNEKIVTGKVEM